MVAAETAVQLGLTVPLLIMGALAGFNNIFKMAKKIYGQGNEGKRDHVEKTK